MTAGPRVRAGYRQALVFYHFGTVNDLLLAALDGVSSRRMAADRDRLADAASVAAVAAAATSTLSHLDAGYVLVAGFLGLELLASLGGASPGDDPRTDRGRAAALGVLDQAGPLARLLDVLGGVRLPGGGKEAG